MAPRLVEEIRDPEPAAPLLTDAEVADAFLKLEKVMGQPLSLARPEPPPPPKVVVKRVMPEREILSAMAGLGTVLAVRLMLACAVGGAFVLSYKALGVTDWRGLAVVGLYTLTVVGPLTWLSTKRT